MQLRTLAPFDKWLDQLHDNAARVRIAMRIERLKGGNSGDYRAVGEGVLELRVHYGPGYRVYYKKYGDEFVVLLCGGDKRTQDTDIRRAKELAKSLEE